MESLDEIVAEVKRRIEAVRHEGISILCTHNQFLYLLMTGFRTKVHNAKYPHSKKKLLKHFKRRAKRK